MSTINLTYRIRGSKRENKEKHAPVNGRTENSRQNATPPSSILNPTHYELAGFSYVDDAGALHEDVAITPEQATDSFGCQYGCGIFEFRKRHNRP